MWYKIIGEPDTKISPQGSGKIDMKKNEVTNKVSVSAVILYPIYVYTSCGIAVQTNQNWTPAQVEAYGNLVESIQCGN